MRLEIQPFMTLRLNISGRLGFLFWNNLGGFTFDPQNCGYPRILPLRDMLKARFVLTNRELT